MTAGMIPMLGWMSAVYMLLISFLNREGLSCIP